MYAYKTLELSEMYIKPPHMLSKADSLIKYSTEIQKLRIIYQISDTRVILPYLYGSVSIHNYYYITRSPGAVFVLD